MTIPSYCTDRAQACAICVVADEGPVVADGEGVLRGGMVRHAGELISQHLRRRSVRQGDVQSPAALFEELAHPIVKFLRREVVER